MKEKALHPGDDPVGVKNEYVPFDRSPCHQERKDDVERAVGEDPNTAKSRCRRKSGTGSMKVNVPGEIRDFVEQPEGENEDHHMVIDGLAECSLNKQMIEYEDRT